MNVRDLLESLVRIPSPSGHEQEAVAFLKQAAATMGFTVRSDEAGNFIAEAGRGPRTLLFVGHIDTVPGNPGVRREGDTLWGRGTVDAKGPLVAALWAARQHLVSEDVRVIVVGAVGEEADSPGARALASWARPDWIIVGEPSGLDGLTLGYKGILRGNLVLRKSVQHGGHPGLGAIESFLDAWNEVRTALRFEDGFGTLQGRLDAIRSEHDGLADTVSARMQVRLPPGASPDDVARRIAAIFEARGAHLDVTEALSAHVADRRTDLVAAFLSSMRAQGITPRPKHKTGTADFNHLARFWPGVPMVAYGPGDSHLDHTPDERVDLREVEQAVEVLDAVMTKIGTAVETSLAVAH